MTLFSVWPAGRVARFGRSRRFEVSSASPRLFPRNGGCVLAGVAYFVKVTTHLCFAGIGLHSPRLFRRYLKKSTSPRRGLKPAVAWRCSPSPAQGVGVRGARLGRAGSGARGARVRTRRQERAARGGKCRRGSRGSDAAALKEFFSSGALRVSAPCFPAARNSMKTW